MSAPSLHENEILRSFALQHSPHLGIVIARSEMIVEVNDAFLNIVGYSREDLLTADLNWTMLSPPGAAPLDERRIEQVRTTGASTPYEREYLHKLGHRVPVLVGSVLIHPEPLTWASYVIDLSENKRAEQLERETRQMSARAELINELAHRINNPLAVVMNVLYLIESDSTLSEESRLLIKPAIDSLAQAVEIARLMLHSEKRPAT